MNTLVAVDHFTMTRTWEGGFTTDHEISAIQQTMAI
jgi:hypothetical protein